jgi:hypothetical protein
VEEEIIELDSPITEGDKTHSQLTLRQPFAGELEKAARADTSVGVVINLINLITKIPRRALENGLCQTDLAKCDNYLNRFTRAGQQAAGQS